MESCLRPQRNIALIILSRTLHFRDINFEINKIDTGEVKIWSPRIWIVSKVKRIDALTPHELMFLSSYFWCKTERFQKLTTYPRRLINNMKTKLFEKSLFGNSGHGEMRGGGGAT